MVSYTDFQQEIHWQNVQHIHSLDMKHAGKIC